MIAYRLNIQEGNLIDNKYRVVKPVGSGSYGDVFLVKNQEDKTFALKVLRLWDVPGDVRDTLVERFKRGYQAAKIPCEQLIHTIDFGTLSGNPYFVMEYCPNGDLSSLIGKDKSNLPKLIRDVLLGLHALHSEGKVHRDLKPENVLIRSNGIAALTDLDVIADRNSQSSLSEKNVFGRPKQVFGSPLYMSPEMSDRKRGGVTYLPTVDIWSLGVMLYELVTDGAFPFADIRPDSDIRVLPKYQENAKEGNWNRQLLRNCLHGRKWEHVIDGCLKPNYQERFQSAVDILCELEPMLGEEAVQIAIDRDSRTTALKRLIVTQGENLGKVYYLKSLLEGRGRMIKIGRVESNDIVLPETEDTYISRHHFTLELSSNGAFWTIKDGQWSREDKQWRPSTNGTYLNATPVTIQGLRVFTGDIITAGEYKFKVE